MSAVSSGHDEIAKTLLSLGAEVARANNQQRTALHYAVWYLRCALSVCLPWGRVPCRLAALAAEGYA